MAKKKENKQEDYIVSILVLLFFGGLIFFLMGDGKEEVQIVKDDVEVEGKHYSLDDEEVVADGQLPAVAGVTAAVAGEHSFQFNVPKINDSIGVNLNVTDAAVAAPALDIDVETEVIADKDGDGLNDLVDVCPDQAGTKENNGCPEVKLTQEEKTKIATAIESVEFETGSANLKASSKENLNNLAQTLKDHPEMKLVIDGHTDSQGDDDKNMQLSKDRANACKAYLVSQGIDAQKITTHGYGETKPIASNDTAEGKAKNRRVAFTFK